jgi:hypothetical protein
MPQGDSGNAAETVVNAAAIERNPPAYMQRVLRQLCSGAVRSWPYPELTIKVTLLPSACRRTLCIDGRFQRTAAVGQTKLAREGTANQHRNTDSFRLRTRHQRGLQAAHIDCDEFMGGGVHEPTNGGKRSACETGGGPPISALTYAFIFVEDRGIRGAAFGLISRMAPIAQRAAARAAGSRIARYKGRRSIAKRARPSPAQARLAGQRARHQIPYVDRM